MSEPPRPSDITSLGSDLTELILSQLPIPSILVASSVCKLWRSVITSPSFSSLVSKKPWFFLFGLNSIFSKNNQAFAFAFDPDSNSWIRLPASLSHQESFIGSNGFFFTTTSSTSSINFSYAPTLKGFGATAPRSNTRAVIPWLVCLRILRVLLGLLLSVGLGLLAA